VALCCRINGNDSSNVDPTLPGRVADTGGHSRGRMTERLKRAKKKGEKKKSPLHPSYKE